MATEDHLCDDCGAGLLKEISDNVKTYYYAMDILSSRYADELDAIKDEVRDDIVSGKLSVRSVMGIHKSLMKLVTS